LPLAPSGPDLPSLAPDALAFLLQVERLYGALVSTADSGSEPTLEGKLVYAGELDSTGRALLVAANIAGAASLAATANPAAQKQAIRDGVADFLVNSLSEALRILKNEVRKREPVSVCVAGSSDDLQAEMLERGVLPDLLRPARDLARQDSVRQEPAPPSPFEAQGSQALRLAANAAGSVQLTWHVASAPAQALPKLDALALACLQPAAHAERRWLRQAPRYLGRMAQGLRLHTCNQGFAEAFMAQARAAVEQGEIATAVEIQLISEFETIRHTLVPPTR
jgi:urocanate hydratase